MVNQLLVTLVNSFLGQGISTSRGNYSYFCPKCKHYKRKLEINFDEQSIFFQNYHCWNAACNLKGKKLDTLFKKFNSQDLEKLYSLTKRTSSLKEYIEKIDILTLPKEFKHFKFNNNLNEKPALSYLKKRGITKYDIIQYNIGYCEEGLYKNKIIIPSYDSNNNLNYYVGRSYNNNYQKYKIPPISRNIIFFESYINWNLPIILCEGVFDAIAIKRNVIPLLGGSIQPILKKRLQKNDIKKIYIVLDSDIKYKTYEMCKELLYNNKIVYLVELSKKDPSEEGFLNMLKLINESKPIDIYSILAKQIT